MNFIKVTDNKNVFDGASGLYGKSRGYIIFRPMVYDVEIKNNTFVSPEETDSPNYGIILENPEKDKLLTEDNIFIGKTVSFQKPLWL